jgi:hypothetical protein
VKSLTEVFVYLTQGSQTRGPSVMITLKITFLFIKDFSCSFWQTKSLKIPQNRCFL